MHIPGRTILYLTSVLAIVLFFSLYEFFSKTPFENSPIHDGIGKQSSVAGRLLDEEIEIVKRDTRKKIIAGIKINVNTATSEDLSLLPGISEKTAENIVKYRIGRGKIKTYRELLNVKGIKEKRLKIIKPFIEL